MTSKAIEGHKGSSKFSVIVVLGCGDMFSDHWTWEEHIRDMVELEDPDHNFVTQVN